MATQPKASGLGAQIPAGARRIARLAEQSALARAQRWFAQEHCWIDEQHLQLCRIAAPTFFEQRRAEWLRARMETLGWRARLDRAGNVLAAFGNESSEPLLAICAHLDTVFAPTRPEEVYFGQGGRLFGPGAADNGSGLTALLALARVLAEIPELHPLASSLLLVANVGEEGEGNLSGMRHLCRPSGPLSGASAILVLDGPSADHITTQALASRRFEIGFAGPGGHSWNDYGTPNPIHALGAFIAGFLETAGERAGPGRRRACSFNFGIVEGGASVNSIPSEARAKLDVRSEEPALIEDLANSLAPLVERSLEKENRAARSGHLTGKIKELGSRPGGRLPEHSPLLVTIQAVDAYLHIRSVVGCASTDANIPLSLGLPALSIGAGGRGGGAHTRQEWYEPDGRELGLRRILLIAAALARQDDAS
ncbi:MAG TPA: M20/M25/M40 family metallo-hydrolase [Bryobacteraceae bacterium]